MDVTGCKSLPPFSSIPVVLCALLCCSSSNFLFLAPSRLAAGRRISLIATNLVRSLGSQEPREPSGRLPRRVIGERCAHFSLVHLGKRTRKDPLTASSSSLLFLLFSFPRTKKRRESDRKMSTNPQHFITHTADLTLRQIRCPKVSSRFLYLGKRDF